MWHTRCSSLVVPGWRLGERVLSLSCALMKSESVRARGSSACSAVCALLAWSVRCVRRAAYAQVGLVHAVWKEAGRNWMEELVE